MTGPRRETVSLRLAVAVAVASIVTLVLVLVAQVLDEPPFDPLGEYPTQQVRSRVEGMEGPAAMVGDVVVVAGIKCNGSDRPVKVRGSLSWVSIDPRGSIVQVGGGTAMRSPGCTSFRFENPMPDAVRDRSVELLGRGIVPIWHITGYEEPIAPNGHPGVRRDWQTENFMVVADGGNGGSE